MSGANERFPCFRPDDSTLDGMLIGASTQLPLCGARTRRHAARLGRCAIAHVYYSRGTKVEQWHPRATANYGPDERYNRDVDRRLPT